MGSALSTAPVMPEQTVDDLHRGEDQMLQARSMCGSGGAMQSTRQRTEEERDASIICHVHHALRHYNATNNEGLEFVPVKPLMAAYVGFRSHIWVHVSFLARRRKITSSKRRRGKDSNDHLKHFFAELRYDHHFGTPTVETCTTIDNLTRKTHLNTSCAFCPKSFEILHPLDGNFVCGKKSQEDEEQGFTRFMNLLEKPYTCPGASSEVKEEETTPKKERRARRWTLLPFNFVTGFLWVFEAKLKAWMSGGASQYISQM